MGALRWALWSPAVHVHFNEDSVVSSSDVHSVGGHRSQTYSNLRFGLLSQDKQHNPLPANLARTIIPTLSNMASGSRVEASPATRL